METIKCTKCGQMMGAASEACPVCGTPVVQNMTVEAFLAGHNVFRGLAEELTYNLKLQTAKPKNVIETSLDMSKFMDEDDNIRDGLDEDVVYNLMNVPITNVLFREKDGSEVFKGTMNDGATHLMMQFYVTEGTEEFEKFKALDIYPRFDQVKNGKIFTLSIDCGSNAQQAAQLYTQILVTVFNADYNLYNKFMTFDMMSKKKAQKQAIK